MPLTSGEFERLRLVLSSFQDGSGWERSSFGTVAGFRQFERALAEVVKGTADENKALFDVVASRLIATGKSVRIGYSCKLKRALELLDSSDLVYIEVSNAVSQFDKHLLHHGFAKGDYISNPTKAGPVILDWIKKLHLADAAARSLDLLNSSYFVLLYNKNATEFRLCEVPADVFLSNKGLSWIAGGNHIKGYFSGTKVIEYYGNAGQLKFYVPKALCTWISPQFQLEKLPVGAKTLFDRADEMFPSAWSLALKLP